MLQPKSKFIISLDFELLWGVRDKRTINSYGENIKGVRKAIPALLELFHQYKVNATFATVGFLFARNKKELIEHTPAVLPQYTSKRYSPYENEYFNQIGSSETEDVYHYAESLIKLIQQYPEQEIASHTFSHFYCLENASLQSFEADLIAAKKIATLYMIDLKSIIFPRNQYSNQHIDICKKLGFTAYRGNEKSKIYNPRKNKEQNKWIRAVRLADTYFNITGHHTFKTKEAEIINVPASRFLRPFSHKLKFLDKIRLNRIKNSMTYAAKNNECYHLWWHPHNFGVNLIENLNFLVEILKHYEILNQQYGMESFTMKRMAEEMHQLV